MMCYRDKTFCLYYKQCSKGWKCDRAWTPERVNEAYQWMGENAPVCFYDDKPECFEEVKQ